MRPISSLRTVSDSTVDVHARRAADVASPARVSRAATGAPPLPDSIYEDCAAAFDTRSSWGCDVTGGAVIVTGAEARAPGDSEPEGLRVVAAWRAMREESTRFAERRGHRRDLAIITASQPDARARALAALDGAGLIATRVVHPGAIVAGSTTISDGAVVLAGAVIEEGARIGRAAIVGAGAVVEAGAVVGDAVAIESRAVIASSSRVGERALVGRGGIVCPRVFIGLGARIDYGEVADRDVEPGGYVGRRTRS